MADTKISALTALVAGDIQHTSDVVAIVDTSVTTTKKATAQAVVNAVLAQNTDTTVTGTINQTTIPTSKTLLVSTDIGSTVQGYDAQLADVAGLAVTDGNFIVGNGTNFVAESGSTARTSLGLGTGDSPEFTAVNIGSATDTTVTRVSAGVIAVEGSNVLLASNIGTSVQAYDAQLADVAGLAVTDGNFIVGNGTNFVAESGATARTSLGLGTGDSPEFTAVNIGSATDTTITRSSAGVIAVEGSNVLMASNIGSTVQAYDAQLADVAGLTPTDNGVIIGNGANFVVESGATLKTSLGLTIGTDVQAYDADTAKTDVAQTFTAAQTFGADVTLNAQSDLRFADSDSSNWVAFQSPATVASNVTWTLPATDGTSNQALVTNGSGTLSWATAGGGASISAGDSKVEVTDTGSNGTIVFNTDGSERMRVTSAGDVGIGNSTARGKLTVSDGTVNTAGEGVYQAYVVGADRSALTEGNLTVQSNDALAINKGGSIAFGGRAVSASAAGANWAKIAGLKENATTAEYGGYLQFSTRPNSGAAAERMRIDSSGNLMVGVTSAATGPGTPLTSVGFSFGSGYASFTSNASRQLDCNRQGDDGALIGFWQANTEEGTISVSGSTVSYNGGHLSRWAQMLTKPDLLKGTVMSNLDEMNVYIAPTTYWTEEDELPEGVSVGDVKVETHEVENEQLNKVKVSDVEGDANVAGVFVNWTYDEAHQVDEINMAMTGDMIIRIAQGVVVQKGDLLMSAGDGTAKPQEDDIVRSKTVAKVTSNHVTCTYADGSYCVPCVLMAC